MGECSGCRPFGLLREFHAGKIEVLLRHPEVRVTCPPHHGEPAVSGWSELAAQVAGDRLGRAQLGCGMLRLRCRAYGVSDFSHRSLQRLNPLHELRDHDSCWGCRPKGLSTGINKPLDFLNQRIVNRRHHGSGLTVLAVRKRAERLERLREKLPGQIPRILALAAANSSSVRTP
jgi:hypothetical protein